MKKKLWILLLSLFCLNGFLLAQDTLQTGNIEGVVIESSGAGLPGQTTGEVLTRFADHALSQRDVSRLVVVVLVLGQLGLDLFALGDGRRFRLIATTTAH